MAQIRLSRGYDHEPHPAGTVFLVERLWPRGLRRDTVELDGWCKDSAPSTELRTWFSHDPAKWTEFCRRYTAELDANPEGWRPLAEATAGGDVTLLFSSRDVEHNNAVALREYQRNRRPVLRPDPQGDAASGAR